MSRLDTLRAKARAITPELEKARAVAEAAENAGRAMTGAERAVYDAAMAKARPVLDALKAARADEAVTTAAHLFAAELGAPARGKTDGRRLNFKGTMAASAAAAMLGGDTLGTKALAPSGATVVPQAFTPDPVALGRAATGLLEPPSLTGPRNRPR